MNHGIKALALSAVLCAAVAGCTSTTASKAEPVVLENTNWMLPLPEKSDCDTPPVLEFLSGNRLAGDLGCNRASDLSCTAPRVRFSLTVTTSSLTKSRPRAVCAVRNS